MRQLFFNYLFHIYMAVPEQALRNLIAKSPPSLPEQEAKASIVDKINEFINTRITLAAREITKNAITKIRDGDVILTYGRCVRSLRW